MAKLIIPREHGAWAMLSIPFIVGFGLGGFKFSLPVLFTAGLVLSLFLARYPLTLLVKYPKRKHLYLRSLYTYLGLSLLLILPLLAIYRLFWLLPFGSVALGLLAGNLALTAKGQERSITANLLGIVGLSLNGALGYYAATGRVNNLSVVVWVVCSLFFGSSLFYVKMLFRESKSSYFRELALLVHLLAFVTVLAAGQLQLVPNLLTVAFLLPLIKVLVAMKQNSVPNLRKIGFSELAFSLAFLAVFFISYAV